MTRAALGRASRSRAPACRSIALAGNGGIALERGRAARARRRGRRRPRSSSARSRCCGATRALELTTWAMALGALMTLPLAPGLPAAIGSAPAERADRRRARSALGAARGRLRRLGVRRAAHVDVSIAAATLYAGPGRRASRRLGLARARRRASVAVLGGAIALAGVALVDAPSALCAAAPKPRSISSACSPSVPAARQHAELRPPRRRRRRTRARGSSRSVAQLAVEDDVHDDEAVRSAARPSSAPRCVPSSLPARRTKRPSVRRSPVALEARVGERRPQPRGVRGDRRRRRSAARRVSGSS